MGEATSPSDRLLDADRRVASRWRIAGWLLLGIVLGAVLVGAFLAYGQPELLLEQMNLRYCG